MLESLYGVGASKLLIATVLIWLALHLLNNIFSPGVREVPGPWAAKLSNLYRLLDVSNGYNHLTLMKQHQKYGDYVRLGPRVVSIRNMKDVSRVYGLKGGFVKSEFYRVQQQLSKGKAMQTIFTTLDEAFHARIKRPVAGAYSMTTLTEYEPLVDRTINTLLTQLDRCYSAPGKPCPIFDWLQYYAFDVIGQLTCSRSFGFLDKGHDVDGIIKSLNEAMDYNGPVGQIPWLDYWFKKNPVLGWVAQPTGAVARFARERLVERLEARAKGEKEGEENPRTPDFVDRFFVAKDAHPDIVDDNQILSYMITNMFAGSDTTAISLRAILYYTVKHPRVYQKLMSELDTAHASGNLSLPATWKESQQLEYFDAVVKEALRLHPAVGLILERIVPAQGLKLDNGTFLPPGTIVGASPWVVHHDKTLFGDDVDDFKPERWLRSVDESLESYEKRLKAMNGATMTFGKGHRTCIGKNISLLEIYKVLPSLFLTFSIEFIDPKEAWKVKNAWFVRQEGIKVHLRRRML